MNEVLQKSEEKMNKAISFYEEDIATIRVGRASASVLDKVTVDYYGQPTPLSQVATLSSPDPRTLTIQPWDTSLVGEVEKAISKSDLGLVPTSDGRNIRITFPALTEERRKELTKVLGKKTEACRVNVRNIRRDAMDALKKQKKDNEITEDDLKNLERDLQKLTDKKIADIDALDAKKQKDIMEI